jgi:hypothetical protein
MLDNLETPVSARPIGAAPNYDLLDLNATQTRAAVMVPMLDWPSDLFNKFTTDTDAEFIE